MTAIRNYTNLKYQVFPTGRPVGDGKVNAVDAGELHTFLGSKQVRH